MLSEERLRRDHVIYIALSINANFTDETICAGLEEEVRSEGDGLLTAVQSVSRLTEPGSKHTTGTVLLMRFVGRFSAGSGSESCTLHSVGHAGGLTFLLLSSVRVCISFTAWC